MKSIHRRLSLGLAAALLIVGLIFMQVSFWLFDQAIRNYLHTHLRTESETLLSAMAQGANGIELDPRRISAAYDRPFSGSYFVVQLSQQQWRSRSSWDYALPTPETHGLMATLIAGPNGQQLLVYCTEYRRYGETIHIAIAQDYTPILSELQRIQWIGTGLGLTALLLILILQRILVVRALRPLQQAEQQIAQLQHGERSSLDTNVARELIPLVNKINHLLQQTETTLKRSRNALGNLGHALKTPLAVLFSLSARNELHQHPQLQQNMQEQLNNIQQRLGRELARARLAGEVLPGSYFVCAKEIPDLFSTLKHIHSQTLTLEWQAPAELVLPWDREDMLELLGNLLDNACKWAQHNVRLIIDAHDKSYKIKVEDDGPGIHSSQRECVLNRGERMDESVEGHGLGLGIVRDIITHCGGELALEDSPLGGLRVIINLPIPASLTS